MVASRSASCYINASSRRMPSRRASKSSSTAWASTAALLPLVSGRWSAQRHTAPSQASSQRSDVWVSNWPACSTRRSRAGSQTAGWSGRSTLSARCTRRGSMQRGSTRPCCMRRWCCSLCTCMSTSTRPAPSARCRAYSSAPSCGAPMPCCSPMRLSVDRREPTVPPRDITGKRRAGQ